MNCTGSVALTAAVRGGKGFEEEDPDYRRDGVEAHSLAAWCLEHEADAWEAPLDAFPSLTPNMMAAVQVYLDFARSLPSRLRYIEHKMHRPEFHPLAFGTGDYISVHTLDEVLDFVDYKHGEGIYVEVDDNPQIKYYVYLFIGENHAEYPDEMTVRLHVVQPRIEGTAPIRTWETRAGSIRRWAHDELRPAMERAANDRYLSVGEWCRFCPAKLICPAMTALQDKFTYHRATPLEKMPADLLGELFDNWTLAVKKFGTKLEAEVKRRAMQGDVVPFTKYVAAYAERVWKGEPPLEAVYGADAWVPRKLKSPAIVEKMPGGAEFVAEHAFKPNNGVSVAHVSSRYKAVEPPKSGAETFAEAVAALEVDAI